MDHRQELYNSTGQLPSRPLAKETGNKSTSLVRICLVYGKLRTSQEISNHRFKKSQKLWLGTVTVDGRTEITTNPKLKSKGQMPRLV